MMLTSVYQVWTHIRSVTGLEAIGSVSMLSLLLIAVATLGITTLGGCHPWDYFPWNCHSWEYWIYPCGLHTMYQLQFDSL
jgi:hypothetical protein